MSQSSSTHSFEVAPRNQTGGITPPRNTSLRPKDFDEKPEILERVIQLDDLEVAYPGLTSMFEIQGWGDHILHPCDSICSLAIKQFYFNMDRPNKHVITSRIANTTIVIRSQDLAITLGVLEEGDDWFLDYVRTTTLFEMIPQIDIMATLFKEGEVFRNPTKSHQLNPKAYVLWQVLLSNILPQFSHHTELSNFAIYLLYRIMTGTKINLPQLLINHMWKCRNQARGCLPYVRLLSSIISNQRRLPESKVVSSSLKFIDTNLFVCKNVLQCIHGDYSYTTPSASKKRKSSYLEDFSQALEDDDIARDIPSCDTLPQAHVRGNLHPASLSTQLAEFCHTILSRLNDLSRRIDVNTGQLLHNQRTMVHQLGESHAFTFDLNEYFFDM